MKRRHIPFVDLAAKFRPLRAQFHRDLDRVLDSGFFILGEEVTRFEDTVRQFAGVPHAVAVGNGTDALTVSLRASRVGAGDEVITTPMSYLATTSTIVLCGATAVFADIDDTLNLDPDGIEDAITERTRAISVVHLAGIPAHVDKIADIAERHGLALIEDCAQSFGATLGGTMTGAFGRFGAISVHPLKNVSALGDGGVILARDAEDARWLRQARNHGHSNRDDCDFWSVNSRLDALHAAFLMSQMTGYPAELARRRRLAAIYRDALGDVMDFPHVPAAAEPSYNWIMGLAHDRGRLMAFLEERGIETKVHYPILIPDLAAARIGCRVHGRIDRARTFVERIISLPTAEHVSEADAEYVCEEIRRFYRPRQQRTATAS